MWVAKKDIRLEMPDGTARLLWADKPIPAELVEHVPAKSRKKAVEAPTAPDTGTVM